MPYRFALAGCGRIAGRHAEQMVSRGQLVAVCDTDTGRASQLAARFVVPSYPSLESLLERHRPDVVSICTPNGTHPRLSIVALEAGCHVLCEKPLTISSHDGKEMIRAAAGAGKKLFVVKQNRYNPPVMAVKKLLNEGSLGMIHSFQLNCFWNRPAAYYDSDWRGTLALDGGTLFTQFSHFIDLLYWLLGDVDEARGLRSAGSGKPIEFEDTGVAWLRMKSGAIGTLNYTINSYGQNMEGSLTLFGEKGTVKIGGQYLNELDFFSVEGEAAPVLAAGRPPNRYGIYEGSMSNHDKVYENLILALGNPHHPFVEAAEALRSVEIIEKIYAASPLL